MDKTIRQALENDRVIDITTTGRKSGQPRRIEIWFHNIDGRIFLTGRPNRRGWYANLLARPELTFHLKHSVQADLPARARIIRDETERRAILARILDNLDRPHYLDTWVKQSPLVEILLTE
jgi:deazaflavin-dependent oxidoreductase (nitroreductase family)